MHKDQNLNYKVLAVKEIKAAKTNCLRIVEQDYNKEVIEDLKKTPKLRKLGLS